MEEDRRRMKALDDEDEENPPDWHDWGHKNDTNKVEYDNEEVEDTTIAYGKTDDGIAWAAPKLTPEQLESLNEDRFE